MLVMSRQRDEEVVIVVPPSDKPRVIRHTVVDIRGDKVRNGYDADKDIEIDRREVYDAKQRDRRKASGSAAPPRRDGYVPGSGS